MKKPTFRPGDKVLCIVNDNYGGVLLDMRHLLTVGKIYEVVSRFPTENSSSDICLKEVDDEHFDTRRFELVCPSLAGEEQAPTDMEQLKALLTKAGVKFDTWHIWQYVDKNTRQPVFGFDGWCLTHGADWDGPYVEYIFDEKGCLVPNSSGLWYQEEGKTLVA